MGMPAPDHTNCGPQGCPQDQPNQQVMRHPAFKPGFKHGYEPPVPAQDQQAPANQEVSNG